MKKGIFRPGTRLVKKYVKTPLKLFLAFSSVKNIYNLYQFICIGLMYK